MDTYFEVRRTLTLLLLLDIIDLIREVCFLVTWIDQVTRKHRLPWTNLICMKHDTWRHLKKLGGAGFLVTTKLYKNYAKSRTGPTTMSISVQTYPVQKRLENGEATRKDGAGWLENPVTW